MNQAPTALNASSSLSQGYGTHGNGKDVSARPANISVAIQNLAERSSVLSAVSEGLQGIVDFLNGPNVAGKDVSNRAPVQQIPLAQINAIAEFTGEKTSEIMSLISEINQAIGR